MAKMSAKAYEKQLADEGKITGVNATNHMLYWEPATDRVMLVPWPDHAARDSRLWSDLACSEHVRKLDFLMRGRLVYITAMQLIVRDGIPPQAVHAALWPLDEYRAGLAEDVPIPESHAKHRR